MADREVYTSLSWQKYGILFPLKMENQKDSEPGRQNIQLGRDYQQKAGDRGLCKLNVATKTQAVLAF